MDFSTSNNLKWFRNEFLEQVLRKAENDNTINITESDIEDAAEKGAYYGSTMFRVTMNITRSTSTAEKISMVIKLLPNKTIGDVMAESTAFPKEIKMYTEILPRMHALLGKAMPEVQREFGAKHYYSENKMPYVIMLEDLSVSGFMLADRTVGLDLPHSVMVMKTLGRFHASSVILREKQPEFFDIFSKSILFETKKMDDFLTGFLVNGVKSGIKTIEKWQNGDQRFAQKLMNRLDALIEDFKSAYACDPQDFNVLIHGDLWINNMMFSYDDTTGDVQDIKLIDYQNSNIASPTVDLQYFIHTSISDSVRENHTVELLKVYHDELTKTFTLLGYKTKAISFETLLEAYEKRAAVGLLWTVVALPILMGERGVKQDLDSIVKKDNITEISVNDACETVWRRLLPLFEEKGVL